MSSVPEGWRHCTLGECLLNQPQYGANASAISFDENLPRYIRITDIVSGQKLSLDAKSLSEESAASYILEDGDIVIARSGNTVGKSYLYRQEVGRAAYAGYLLKLVTDKQLLNPSYLIQYLDSGDFWSWVGAINRAGAQPNINAKEYASLAFPLPPLPEQKRIAAILSSVDDAIAATEAVIEQTQRVKEGLLQDLLTRGIGHTRFKQTEIGEIPEGWEVKRLEELAGEQPNSFTIGPFGSNLKMTDYRAEGVPVVFVRDIKANNFSWKSNVYVTSEKAQELSAHSVCGGDIVITKMGLPPGIAAEYPSGMPEGIITADILRLKPNSSMDKCFLCEMLNSHMVAKQVDLITGGQTRPKLTLRDYRRLLVACPPIHEQKKLVEYLTSMAATTKCERRKLESLQQTKRGLMQDLLSGDVRVAV